MMSIIKIEHADHNSSKSIAFDVMTGDTIRETFVLERAGLFQLITLSGGISLRQVSEVELAERERVRQEDIAAEAAAVKAQADKDAAEQHAKHEAEQAERKAAAERRLAETHPDLAPFSSGKEPAHPSKPGVVFVDQEVPGPKVQG